MPGLSLRQAATETGTSKSTILRAIQAGRLSATRTDDGGYSIDPAELFRVYQPKEIGAPERSSHHGVGQVAPAETTDNGAPGTAGDVDLRIRTAALEAQVEALRSILEAEKRRGEELRTDMEHWRAQAERLALPAPVSAPTNEPKERTSVFSRLLKRTG